MSSRSMRTPKEKARREKNRALLQLSNIGSVDDMGTPHQRPLETSVCTIHQYRCGTMLTFSDIFQQDTHGCIKCQLSCQNKFLQAFSVLPPFPGKCFLHSQVC